MLLACITYTHQCIFLLLWVLYKGDELRTLVFLIFRCVALLQLLIFPSFDRGCKADNDKIPNARKKIKKEWERQKQWKKQSVPLVKESWSLRTLMSVSARTWNENQLMINEYSSIDWIARNESNWIHDTSLSMLPTRS